MLKGIPEILSPDLLKVLAEMGHGDEIVVGDANFPAASTAKFCIRADGAGGPALLDAILQLFPLDSYVDAPVTYMQVVPGDPDPPEIWKTYQKILEKHAPGVKTEILERFAFYERTKAAYAVVANSERADYACFILKKGCL
jgi:L-fucose mutarotase